MSTTQYREPPDYRPSLGKSRGTPNRAPESLFKDAVQRDPSLCNSCFSERFDFEERQFLCGELGWLDWSRRYPIPGRNAPDVSRELRRGRPIFCAHCGHKNGKDRCLSHREATAHAGRLSAALSRRGVEHDRKTLLAVTVDKISEPDTTGVEDAAVFAPAVREAVLAVQ